MGDASWYHSACVSVRAATGLPPYCRHVMLHFVYEHTTSKRVLTKSPPATVRQHGMAIWTDATACVPTTSPCVTIELWHAHQDHDLFLGCVDVALTKSPPTPEVGPIWVMVHAARYEGVPTRGMSLEVVVSYVQASNLRRTKPVEAAPSVVDPAFRFRVPHLDINWADVVSTNVHEIFFLGTTEPLLALQSTVLYGNTLATLDIPVEKDHEKAFQLCQFAAQYLQSCVDLLTQRQAQYEGALTDLLQRQADLRDQRQAKKHLLHKLRKQATDCDVLLTAYDVVAAKLPPPTAAPPPATRTVPPSAAPIAPAETTPSLPSVEKTTDHESLKATAMLATYEERMEKQRLAKEATRAERIEAEKRRLLQTMAEQAKQREWRDAVALQDSAAVHRAACRLQAWCRHLAFRNRYRRDHQRFLAAQCIQAKVRQRLATRAVLQLRRRRAIEATQAHLRYQHVQREEAARVEAQRQVDIKALEPVLLLWNDLEHAFATAVENGTDVFGFFDRKRCGSVDRASFRQQLARLGFDVPRPVIRRLIQQIHVKNQTESPHLVFTRLQFNTAFGLQDVVPPPPAVIEPIAVVAPRVQEDHVPLDETPPTPTGNMDSIEHLSRVIHALRERILEAATARLGRGTSLSFEAMKAALASVFESLDTEACGDLPLATFRDGLQSALHLHFEDDVWAIVDACLDVDGSGSVSITEFVSFALTSPASEELGVLGYRLRDAILQRVKAARKEAGGLEAAVQAVFRPLYKHATDVAPVPAFCHTLKQLHLGFSPAQLSRLVVRLDHDGDHTISLDELLRWLKLRSGPKVVVAQEPQPRLSMSSLVVKQVREALVAVAHARHAGSVKSLFDAMDANGSKQLNAREIHAFLKEHTPLPFSAIDAAVTCMDVGGNGVVSKSELVAFCSEATESEEVGVLAEHCRAALVHLEVPALQAWFEALDPTSRGQVRVGEVKKALKKLVKLHDHELDLVLLRLDKDKSGAISTAEMLSWVHPVRDIEVLLALVESNASLQDLSIEALVAVLDADGNGAVGIDELHAGLNLFGLRLQRAEAALLLDEFDIDNDGILTKGELNAMLTSNTKDTYSSDEDEGNDRDAPDDAYGYGEDGFDDE
ncbi:hypothetical protein SPRG_06985 [Saprolegnia parasitica CBS 223.65]|uniref:EF-hand domain-containing protein n=1 Tax=Saprolegnia parasitica (strain CBS 223.65) TaxID=695850 RepID=A0A067CA69_SAPPC|nr:hypothetical protein SPRG_06985 [Saprolegnia parasitica CBS 223.65]KDO27398.1 hypothetical protein SPRG_06985 [Saprolegnia parasitica CBS 223.65]|eukprot:XP_012201838.1 hypothetical protein SPRG_06985 [Saprolegnia parasitica CBS 223.65]